MTDPAEELARELSEFCQSHTEVTAYPVLARWILERYVPKLAEPFPCVVNGVAFNILQNGDGTLTLCYEQSRIPIPMYPHRKPAPDAHAERVREPRVDVQLDCRPGPIYWAPRDYSTELGVLAKRVAAVEVKAGECARSAARESLVFATQGRELAQRNLALAERITALEQRLGALDDPTGGSGT